MAVTLVVQTGKHKGTKLVLSKPELIVGRDETCGLRLTSGGVSREHCKLRHDNGKCFVSDMGSQNGTIVNGDVIEAEVELKAGDRLEIGPMIFVMAEKSAAKTAEQTAEQTAEKTVEKTVEKQKPAKQKAKTKAKPSSSAARKSRPKDVTSDDEIAGWLSEGLGDELGSADSTIVMRAMPSDDLAAAENASSGMIPDLPNDDSQLAMEPTQKKFASLAEEAQDIIRRHYEKTGETPKY